MWLASRGHAQRSTSLIRCAGSQTRAPFPRPIQLKLIAQSMMLGSNSETAPAFILGLGPNGYGHARSLARVGVPAVGFYYSHRHFGRFSRMLHANPISRSLSPEQLADILIQRAASFRGQPVLFPASDEFAFLVTQARGKRSGQFAVHLEGAVTRRQQREKARKNR